MRECASMYMYIYFLFIRLAALFGHKKAKLLVEGQKQMANIQMPKSAIWIHTASVGEFEQARPLIEKLRALQPQQKIVVTFFSPSGYEARKNFRDVNGIYYLPFATRRNARRFLDALQPRMAIFVKYEFWPAYLRELKKRSIPTYSISAIFRPKQLFFWPWGKLHLQLLKCFTHIYVQDEDSLDLLAKYGITQATVAGDTRFDRVHTVMENGLNTTDERLNLVEQFVNGSDRVIVAGSTWPKDEELLAKYIRQLSKFDLSNNRVPAGLRTINYQLSTKLILVPHELDEEHLHTIFQLFQGRFVRLSEATPVTMLHASVLVVDTMGILSRIYRYGQVAYIGGGFGVGIHNTIEAAVYGMPVIFGPNYRHFREAKGLINAGAARSISNYAELAAALDTALDNHASIGAKAAAYITSELGATEKIYINIFKQQ